MQKSRKEQRTRCNRGVVSRSCEEYTQSCSILQVFTTCLKNKNNRVQALAMGSIHTSQMKPCRTNQQEQLRVE